VGSIEKAKAELQRKAISREVREKTGSMSLEIVMFLAGFAGEKAGLGPQYTCFWHVSF